MKISDLSEDGRIVKGVNTTVDVAPNEIKTQAAKFGNTVDKDGKPPTLSKKVKGNSTNVLFNLGLTEGIKLRLERDKHIDVLHIMDTKDKQRIEVRGKKGYETGGYDANDKLHQVLDRVGKAANIAELINGEVVSINPNHPQGTRAIRTARDVLQTEEKRFTAMEQACIEGGHDITDLYEKESAPKKPGRLFTQLQNFAEGKNSGPQMTPDEIEFELLRDAEKRRLAGEYKNLGPELFVLSYGAALAQSIAAYIGMTELTALQRFLAKKGIDAVSENFADGKKKGKSRPGRVKKSGASCNGSVTALRKRAKKASGEKAKMYHWCANMKSGRKKK
jgi:hypothetical protein